MADEIRAYDALSQDAFASNPEALEQLRQFAQHLEEKNLDILLPEPCFVIQTETEEGDLIYINVCKSSQVAEPQVVEQDDMSHAIRIPLSLGAARTEIDHRSKACTVYDAVLNPKSVEDSEKDAESKEFLLELIACWLEQKNKIKISRNFVLPRLEKNYIGTQVEFQTIRLDTKKDQKITEVSDPQKNTSEKQTSAQTPKIVPIAEATPKPIITVPAPKQEIKPQVPKIVEPKFHIELKDKLAVEVSFELPLVVSSGFRLLSFCRKMIDHPFFLLKAPGSVMYRTSTKKLAFFFEK
eukprot:TRINITY_DN4489_c0_g2_i2.p1 TRINITY_DN4489_c0_g2~~TRINITY_DN4489_c0_g2_i2.p1  ORF type:complete len:296 (+),score=61.32 TRINITY_DN4489_c0_g2_i2:143-1030(+)